LKARIQLLSRAALDKAGVPLKNQAMKKWGIISAVLVIVGVLAASSPAYAIDPPDSMSILSARVVQNTVEPGDMAIVFHYNLAYAEYPSEPASESIMFRLYSPDGSTLHATTVPYVFFANGYGQGVGGFYFSAADMPPTGWGGAYRVNIAGSPAHFDPLPDPYYYVLSVDDYSGVEDPAENQELMKSYIITVCRSLEIAYPTVTLHGTTDVGTVLTAVGETYFRGAIPGITGTAPTLFFTQFYTPEAMELTYTNDLGATYAARLVGTDVMDGFDAVGAEFGISGQTVAAFLFIVAAIALIVFLAYKGWGTEPGLAGGAIILTMGTVLLGDALMAIRLTMGLIAGMMVFYVLVFKRA